MILIAHFLYSLLNNLNYVCSTAVYFAASFAAAESICFVIVLTTRQRKLYHICRFSFHFFLHQALRNFLHQCYSFFVARHHPKYYKKVLTL